jgi:hypothetical protein
MSKKTKFKEASLFVQSHNPNAPPQLLILSILQRSHWYPCKLEFYKYTARRATLCCHCCHWQHSKPLDWERVQYDVLGIVLYWIILTMAAGTIPEWPTSIIAKDAKSFLKLQFSFNFKRNALSRWYARGVPARCTNLLQYGKLKKRKRK